MTKVKLKRKKLRGGPIIEIDPQVLRWREKRKKLGLYKPARKPKKSLEEPKSEMPSDEAIWETEKDLWDILK